MAIEVVNAFMHERDAMDWAHDIGLSETPTLVRKKECIVFKSRSTA